MSSIKPTPAKVQELLQDNCSSLYKEVSQTGIEGNEVFDTLLRSDNILSSPIRFRTGPIPTITASSACPDIQSSPPELLSSPTLTREETVSIHHRFCLEDGTRELIRWHPKERRLELAKEFYLKIKDSEILKSKWSLRRIAELYDVNRETLTGRINGRNSRKDASISMQ